MLVYIFLAVCWCVLALVWCFRAAAPLPGIPGPPHHWLLGAVPTLAKNKHRFYDWNLEMSEKFKRTWQLSIPGRRAIKLVSGDCIQHVLKNTDIYVKTLTPSDSRVWQELTGNVGLLMAQDQAWRDTRKTTSHLMSAAQLRTKIEESFVETGRLLVDKLIQNEGKEVNMQDLFSRFTMDTFCDIAFGQSPGCLLQDEEPHFSVCFDRLQQRIIQRRIEPGPVMRFKMMFGLKEEKLMATDYKYVSEFITSIVLAAQARNAQSDVPPTSDLVTLLVADARKQGKEISPKDLQDHALTLLLAGRDTTASALTSIFMLLSTHPEAEAKVAAEIAEKVGDKVPTYENVADLKYCEAVMNEALRLYPPAPLNYRKCRTADKLPDGTVVPVGAEVHWFPWVHGRTADLYPDPFTFKPERWLEGNPPALHLFENPVFGAGPRVCLGRSMAYLEVRIMMALLFQRVRLKLVPGQSLDEFALSVTLLREHGVLMNVRLI